MATGRFRYSHVSLTLSPNWNSDTLAVAEKNQCRIAQSFVGVGHHNSESEFPSRSLMPGIFYWLAKVSISTISTATFL